MTVVEWGFGRPGPGALAAARRRFRKKARQPVREAGRVYATRGLPDLSRVRVNFRLYRMDIGASALDGPPLR